MYAHIMCKILVNTNFYPKKKEREREDGEGRLLNNGGHKSVY